MKPVHALGGPSAALLACALAAACAEEREEAPVAVAETEEICEGDAVLAKAGDAARYASCTEIRGKLLLKRSELPSLALPRLRTIGGRISVRKNARLASLSLPALEKVGGAPGDDVVIEQNAALGRVELGKLARVDGGLAVRENPALTDLELGGLAEVGGAGIEISGAAALASIAFPRLRSADYLAVSGCGRLGAIEAPLLEQVLEVAVERNPSLERISMPSLTKIYADPGKNAVRTGLVISGNASLKSLRGLSRLEGLGRRGPLRIVGNASLPTCEATGLQRTLSGKGWKGQAAICGNLGDDCGREECPAAP